MKDLALSLKKLYTTLPLLFCFLSPAIAWGQCQLCQLEKKHAQKVVDFLRTQKDVVLYVGCTHNEIARKVSISEVRMEPVELPNSQVLYEIYIKGTVLLTFHIKDGKATKYEYVNLDIDEGIDITYVHIQTGSYYAEIGKYFYSDATCLGIYLGYECNPCIDPFEYPRLR